MSQKNPGQVWTAAELKNHLPVRCYFILKGDQESGNVVRFHKCQGGFLEGVVIQETHVFRKKDDPGQAAVVYKPLKPKDQAGRKVRIHLNNDKAKLVSLFPYGNRWGV